MNRGGTGVAPVAIVVHAYYDEDARIRRHAEALVQSGRTVHAFALRRPGDPPVSVVDEVTVHRLPVRRHQGAALAIYLAEYLAFLAAAAVSLAATHRRHRFGLVHVASIPDFLVFASLPLRVLGVPVLLDLHEAMPEFFRSRFPRASGRLALRLLRAQEAASIRYADAVLTVNDALAARLVDLGVPRERVTVTLNAPSLTLFDPSRHPERLFAADGTVRLVYAGALTPTYELDVVVRAMRVLRDTRPDLEIRLDVYGRGDSEAALRALAAECAVADRVQLHGRIPLEMVPAAIAASDIGLAPTRRDPFTDISLSTKIFEYGAMRRPVVASALPTLGRYFRDEEVLTYLPGDPASLAEAVLRLVDDPDERHAKVERTAVRVSELSWEREAERYRVLVDRLVDRRSDNRAGRGQGEVMEKQ